MIAATLIAGALAATAASADTFTRYSRVGDWEIAVNANMGPGCVAIQRFVGPTSQVQMGIDAKSEPKTGYLAILVENAEGIAAGEKIPASFDVDGQIFEATFTGQQTAGFGGATAPVNDADLIYALGSKKSLTINYGEGKRVIVDLTGAGEAFAALRSCQEAQ